MPEPAITTKVPLPNSKNGTHLYAQGFGTWQAAPGVVRKAVVEAIRAGYRLIDCARIYRNQVEVGEAISAALKEGLIKSRSELVIVSKIWNTDHAPEDVLRSTQQTIKELQCGYLDLQLIHFPVSWKHINHPEAYTTGKREILYPTDKATGGTLQGGVPLIETWRGLEALQRAGLAREIGVSNCNIAQLEDIISHGGVKPVVNQIELHPWLQQWSLRGYHEKQGIVTMAYCPLGIGRDDPKAGLLFHPEIVDIAKGEFGPNTKNGARLLLQWNIQVGNVTLSKSVTADRIAVNAGVPYGGLSDKTMKRIKEFGDKYQKRTSNPTNYLATPAPLFSQL